MGNEAPRLENVAQSGQDLEMSNDDFTYHEDINDVREATMEDILFTPTSMKYVISCVGGSRIEKELEYKHPILPGPICR